MGTCAPRFVEEIFAPIACALITNCLTLLVRGSFRYILLVFMPVSPNQGGGLAVVCSYCVSLPTSRMYDGGAVLMQICSQCKLSYPRSLLIVTIIIKVDVDVNLFACSSGPCLEHATFVPSYSFFCPTCSN
jgi:hypothetical protein